MLKNKVTISVLGILGALALGFFMFCPLAVKNSPEQAEFFGYTPEPDETAAFVASLPTPTIADADPNLFRGDKVDTFLYRSLYKAYKVKLNKEFVVGSQGIGDCVSWSWAHCADIHSAVLWDIGAIGDWKPAATEAIYGGSRVEARGVSRGGYSDGSYGGAAAKWVKEFGVVFREKYTDHDLTIYSATRAKAWGNFGCGGADDNGKLDAIAKEHPIKDVTLVRSFDEAAAAIQSGYPVSVCSGQGFNSVRDSDGFCKPQGSWSHAMAFISVRFGNRPGLLCLNSWGPKASSGPKYPDDAPDGAFWVDADVATRMLKGGDSFAVSGFEGFPYRDLRHGDWVRVKPRNHVTIDEQNYALAN